MCISILDKLSTFEKLSILVRLTVRVMGEAHTEQIQNLQLALQLAGRGWFIFPCNPDKTPKLKWKDQATTNQAEIRKWWACWPQALIGIYCQRSGFFAVDIDVKHGHNGFESWTRLINTYSGGVQPAIGPMQDTPSGGMHLLFKLPADIIIPNNSGKLGDGLDLRSNGYICTGGDYHWQRGHGPELELTPAPPWLLDLIQNMSKGASRMHVTAVHPSRSGDVITWQPEEHKD
jgi:hypothetical protein